MRFNLKNRPTKITQHVPEKQEKFIVNEVEEWFEGFEAELREIWDKKGYDDEPTFDELIKEILGE